jgi:hypothetical protein
MAILRNNPMMGTATGTVGLVYFRIVRGKQIVCNRPPRGRKFTQRQLENQERFGQSSKNTKALLQDPAIKEKYKARIDNNKFTAHMVAQSDMMNAPTVKDIDVSSYTGNVGDEIVVKANDDFGVTKVVVTVVAESGAVIESGEAVQNATLYLNWHYKASISNPDFKTSTIKVAAFDLPGNVGKMEYVL